MDIFYKTVHGWSVTGFERECLYNTAREIEQQFGNTTMVNIGVLHGATMHCLRAGAPQAQLYGIDIDYDLYPVKNKEKLNATLLKGNSNICHNEFQDNIHFLFIDGDHTYPSVKADISGWSPKVVVGGIMAFHDYLNTPPKHLIGVKKAIDKWFILEGHHWEQLPSVDSIRRFKKL